MPQTYRGFFQRTRTGRFFYGRVNDYRLRDALSAVANEVQSASVAPTAGEAPLAVNGTVPAKTALTITMVGNRASWPAQAGVTGGGKSVNPLQGGAAVNTDTPYGGGVNASYARVNNPSGVTGGTVAWNWDDGSPAESTDFNQVDPHTYATNGTFEPTINVTDNLGRVNTQQVATVTVGAATPPVFTVAPAADNITDTAFDIDATIDQNGNLYAIVLADASPAPTSAAVKAGTGDLAAGNTSPVAVLATVAGTISLTGLTAATAYDVYVVAEDSLGNLQAAPTKVDVTTLP